MFKKKSKPAPKQEPIVPTEAVSEVVQRDSITESQPTAAERNLIAELSSLRAAGANAVPSTPDVPISSPTAEPVQPQIDPAEAKVLAFIRICHVTDGLTYKEISGGTELMIAIVKRALASLVANGTVKHSGEAEAEANRRRYRLAASVPVQPAPPAQWSPSAEAIWSAEQRKRALAADRLAHPEPPIKRYEPTEAEVQAELGKQTTIILTSEERKQLDVSMRNRREINPNAFIVR